MASCLHCGEFIDLKRWICEKCENKYIKLWDESKKKQKPTKSNYIGKRRELNDTPYLPDKG